MEFTPEERRQRIYEIAEADGEYQKIKAEYELAQTRFAKFADKLPGFLRNLVWSYPGMYHFLHHHLLNIICENMVFPEEKQ